MMRLLAWPAVSGEMAAERTTGGGPLARRTPRAAVAVIFVFWFLSMVSGCDWRCRGGGGGTTLGAVWKGGQRDRGEFAGFRNGWACVLLLGRDEC